MDEVDFDLMRIALTEARAAEAGGDVPVGAAVLHLPTGRVIGLGRNRREADSDPTGHAEIVAMRHAARILQRWRLYDCILAVTLEPCPMCAGAMVNARLARLIYGCRDPKAGAAHSLLQLCDDPRLNHRLIIRPDILADESRELLQQFFRNKRIIGKKKE